MKNLENKLKIERMRKAEKGERMLMLNQERNKKNKIEREQKDKE